MLAAIKHYIMLWNVKNDFPPACDFQISLTINCESIWPGLSWKSCLTLVLFLVNFCKIMFTQLSVNVSVVEYLDKSMLELWPTKILPWVLTFALTKDEDQSTGYNYCSATPFYCPCPHFFRNKTKSLISFSSKPFVVWAIFIKQKWHTSKCFCTASENAHK